MSGENGATKAKEHYGYSVAVCAGVLKQPYKCKKKNLLKKRRIHDTLHLFKKKKKPESKM